MLTSEVDFVTASSSEKISLHVEEHFI